MYLFLSFFLSLFFPSQIFAEESTTSASDKNLTEEVRQMVAKKVKEIQQSDTNDSPVSTSIPKAIIGTISKIEKNQITVTSENNSKIVTVSDETVFIDAKKKKIKIDDLKSGQVILSMGYYDQYNNFNTKRIIITTADAIKNNNEIVLGKIADISQTSNILVLIPIKNKNTQYQIKSDSATKVVNENGDALDINKLKTGQKVVVVIQPDAKIANTFDVSKIITFDSNSNSTSPTPTPKK